MSRPLLLAVLALAAGCPEPDDGTASADGCGLSVTGTLHDGEYEHCAFIGSGHADENDYVIAAWGRPDCDFTQCEMMLTLDDVGPGGQTCGQDALVQMVVSDPGWTDENGPYGFWSHCQSGNCPEETVGSCDIDVSSVEDDSAAGVYLGAWAGTATGTLIRSDGRNDAQSVEVTVTGAFTDTDPG
jgi:hypothetical protein